MIILADGGSTKVDWRLIEGGKEIERISTKGANPFFRSREEIGLELAGTLKPALAGRRAEGVYFFGAGCVGDKRHIVAGAIADNVEAGRIEIESDLLAAARGLCGDRPGIACIIGTGSNSCFWDGERIVENVSPLGYVLGDEGSGAVLGKLFVGACLKGLLTEGLREKFLAEYDLTPADILDRVYRQPLANRFLAGLSPFVAANLGDEGIRAMVTGAFRDFFARNVMQYDYRSHEVHFTGSVAWHYRELLRETGIGMGIRMGTITQSPMEGLIKYYAAKEIE
jgi:N-acetylglucosamine kinase-like BadF-type ATPase